MITTSVSRRPVLPRSVADPLSEIAYNLLVVYGLRLRLVTCGGDELPVDRIPARPREPLATLMTATEFRVARMVAAGQSNRQIGVWLSISEKTVETHITHIYRKTGTRSRGALGYLVGKEEAAQRARSGPSLVPSGAGRSD